MKLRLERFLLNETCTIGRLFIEDNFECYTLELPVVDGLPGSAIPTGIFPVVNLFSPKFNRKVPHIMEIPGRSEIEMHFGNTVEDTNGCVLLGETWVESNPCFIGGSRMAFEQLYMKFTAALNAGETVNIEILS